MIKKKVINLILRHENKFTINPTLAYQMKETYTQQSLSASLIKK